MQKLPYFHPTKLEREWIKKERHTADLITLLWQNTSKKDHADPDFLRVLIRCSWVNGGPDTDEPSRVLRNKHIAPWLGLESTTSDNEIAETLHRRLGLSVSKSEWLVRTPSGITNYYKPLRKEFQKQVAKHAATISKAFTMASVKGLQTEDKIRTVTKLVLGLPKFATPRKGKASMMNGLAPVLVCLDPERRYPLMNAPTRRLLSALGRQADIEGALSLSRLIGHYGIKNSLYLDVYATNRQSQFVPASAKTVKVPDPQTVGLKAEEDVAASYAKKTVVVRRRHNALINKFRRVVEWNHVLLESEYDVLIQDWKPGRWLLIEGKTETSGPSGRTQLRQAIGQLFDYRWRSFPDKMNKVDLAILTPSKPADEILHLLDSLRIEALWFEGSTLEGTVRLT